ncbi:MAG: hypothetical protein WBF71_10375, partial [Microthrixaceae bacterium]
MASDHGVRTTRPGPGPARRSGWIGPAVVVVVLCLVAIPVTAVAVWALRPDGHWSMDAATRILGQGRTWRLVVVTVAQAAVSAAVTVVVGVLVASVFGRFRFRGRSGLMAILTVPFVLPSVVVGAAFGSIFGPQGLFDARGTWWLIIVAHTAFNLAVVT